MTVCNEIDLFDKVFPNTKPIEYSQIKTRLKRDFKWDGILMPQNY
jgi:hypothetical protein